MSGNTTYFGIQYPSSSDYVKDGATAIQTVATGFDSAVAIPTYNAQTGTTYTFALTDIGKVVTASNAASQTYTIPPQASVVWVANTTLNVTNLGAGVVTFAGGAGVTVTNTAQTLTQYQSAQLIRTGSNAWTVVPTSGKLSAPGLTLINTSSFSAVASHSVNDVFSATYTNYRLIFESTHSSTGTTLRLRFRVGGADNTSSNYVFSAGVSNSAAGWSNIASSTGTTSFYAGELYDKSSNGIIDVFSPFVADNTQYLETGFSQTNGNATAATYGGGGMTVTTSYTGFTLFPATLNMTGSVSVYGYNI